MDEQTGKAVRDAIGPKAFLEKMNAIGAKFQGGEFITDGDNTEPSSFGMSPQAAAAEIQRLKGDADWNARRFGNDEAAAQVARSEMLKLQKIVSEAHDRDWET